MGKKSILYISLVIVSSALIVYILGYNEGNHSTNGFKRTFVNPEITFLNVSLLPNQYGIIGNSNEATILNNYNDKFHLFEINHSSHSINMINLNIPSSFRTKSNVYKGIWNDRIFLSNPYSDITILKDDTSELYSAKGLRFDFFKAISRSSLIVRAKRGINDKSNRELVKLQLSKDVTQTDKFLIPKQVDGFFCNDGWLHYDNEHSSIFYMYFYRGEFICLDTNLNVKYKAKTIDTITKAKIKTALYTTKLKSGYFGRGTTQTTPTHITNRYLTTNKNRVYVLSGLIADNESSSAFKKKQAIDVYSLDNGKYVHSFYIPKYKGQKLKEFQIKDNKLIAIFGIYLVWYKFKEV